MQFITIVETNHKEHETFIHYCQWNGNEKELQKLMNVIDTSEGGDELDGDVSTFVCSNVLISETAADEHMQLEYGSYSHMFQKHVGVFKSPKFDYIRDSLEASRSLDEFFYGCKIKNYFTPKKLETME